jgi:hypothetical protein
MSPMMLRHMSVMLIAIPAFAPELSPPLADDAAVVFRVDEEVGVCEEVEGEGEESSRDNAMLDDVAAAASDLAAMLRRSEEGMMAILDV